MAASAPLAPKVQLSWPCARCTGTAVDPETGRRCTKCVNSPGWSKQEHVSLAALQQLLDAS